MRKRSKSRRKKINKYAEHSKAPKYLHPPRCSTKSRFRTSQGAERVRAKIEKAHPDRSLRTYFCPSCQRYHHTSVKEFASEDNQR